MRCHLHMRPRIEQFDPSNQRILLRELNIIRLFSGFVVYCTSLSLFHSICHGLYNPLFKMVEHKSTYEKRHITEQPITLQNWYHHVNWLSTTLILIVPIIGCIAAPFIPLKLPTAIWAIIYYFWTGLGITAGYHRLWSHRSYEA